MKLHLPLFAILATVTLAGCHSASAAQVAAEQMDAEIPRSGHFLYHTAVLR